MSLFLSQNPSTLLTKNLRPSKCEEKTNVSSIIFSKLPTSSFQGEKVFSEKSTSGDFVSFSSNFQQNRKYFLFENKNRGKRTTVRAQNDFQKKSEEILDEGEMAVGEAAAKVAIATFDARVKVQEAADAVGNKVKEANQTVQDIFSEQDSDSGSKKINEEDSSIDTNDKKK